MDDLLFGSAVQIARAIREKQVSCVEVMQVHLDRIEAVNPQLNALVYHQPEKLLAEAHAKDEAIQRGESIGVLHGVPVTIKDNIGVAGMVCTTGTLGFADNIVEQDATMVKRLREAGAIIVGLTNMPELGVAFESDNLVYGRTNNPYDLSRTAGGSSGGESAIISAGGSAIGLGNDGAGSVRTPAGWCGMVGLKPTTGRLPVTGHVTTSYSGYYPGVSSDGPMARTVEDINLVLPIIAGSDGYDPAIIDMPIRNMREVDVSSLRIAYYTDDGYSTPDESIQQTVQQVATALSEMGAQVTEVRPSCLGEAHEMRMKFYALSLHRIEETLAKMGTETYSLLLQRFLDTVAPYRDLGRSELIDLTRQLGNFRHQMLRFMQDYDAILCPLNANVAPKHGESSFEDASYTIAFNLTGYPAISVRAGTTDDGLPIAVQVASHRWREDIALAIAYQIEQHFGGYQRPEI